MTARSIIEQIFFTGAVFFDTSGRGYIGSNGVFFMRHDGSKIIPALEKFVNLWSRSKKNRETLMMDPLASAVSMIERHGLVVMFHGIAMYDVVISRDRPKLTQDQLNWIDAHFSQGLGESVLWFKTIDAPPTKTTVGALLYGEKEPRRMDKVIRQKTKWEKRTPADDEFDAMVNDYAASVKPDNRPAHQKPQPITHAPPPGYDPKASGKKDVLRMRWTKGFPAPAKWSPNQDPKLTVHS